MGDSRAPARERFYHRVLGDVEDAGVPFLIGGYHALSSYTGITRDTKDLDVFIRPGDLEPLLEHLAGRGYRTETLASHWLAKAFDDGRFIDVIFSSGNGVAEVDDVWFEHAPPATVFRREVRLIPPEEMIWSKGFIMERNRYDGADVAHLLRARGACLDWRRLLARFGRHWPVLLSHLVLYRFIYPADADRVPPWVLEELLGRARMDAPGKEEDRVCRGTLLSLLEYLPDVRDWGYADGRLPPNGRMSEGQIAHWTSLFPDPPGSRPSA